MLASSKNTSEAVTCSWQFMTYVIENRVRKDRKENQLFILKATFTWTLHVLVLSWLEFYPFKPEAHLNNTKKIQILLKKHNMSPFQRPAQGKNRHSL
jgi:hypothetical protein